MSFFQKISSVFGLAAKKPTNENGPKKSSSLIIDNPAVIRDLGIGLKPLPLNVPPYRESDRSAILAAMREQEYMLFQWS